MDYTMITPFGMIGDLNGPMFWWFAYFLGIPRVCFQFIEINLLLINS